MMGGWVLMGMGAVEGWIAPVPVPRGERRGTPASPTAAGSAAPPGALAYLGSSAGPRRRGVEGWNRLY